MAEPQLVQKYTFEEYLEIDEQSDLRYEYRKGEIFAMAGASSNHITIRLNLGFSLRSKIKAKGAKCKTYTSDMRVQISPKNIYYYPDLVVSCDKEIEKDPKLLYYPILIAEVLSDSTYNKDTSEKLFNYLQISSLQYYFIIAQNQVSVSLYERAEIGWVVKFFREMSDVICLDKMDISISVKDLYEDVYWAEN